MRLTQRRKKKGKLEDLLIGFLDPAEHVEPAAQVVGQTKDDDDDQPDTGPDAELAAKRMAALKKQNDRRSGQSRNTDGARHIQKARSAGSGVPVFKFVPKHYDSVFRLSETRTKRSVNSNGRS